MTKPRLLDLFCGAGGASVGYARAGFEVDGIDFHLQPHYPFTFVLDNVMSVLEDNPSWLKDYDAIHASPPCQGYSRMNHIHKRSYPLLIEPVRNHLLLLGIPYVIENVEGAPLLDPITLCGTMFGLKVIRHRLFETSFPLTAPSGCGSHEGEFYSPAGHGDPNWRHRSKNPHLSGKGYTDRCRAAMGIDWMNRDELAEAIPPSYTEHVGHALLAHLHSSHAAP